MADGAPAGRRRVAGSFAAFGVGFLGSLLVLGWLLNSGATTAIVVSVVVALLAAVVVYLRGSRALAAPIGESDTPSKAN